MNLRARVFLAVTATIVASAVAVSGAVAAPPDSQNSQERSRASKSQPNIIVIQTDDQTVADLQYMPNTQRLIAANGMTFDQMVTPFPICCPSRAAQMTGSYPHNNGVSANFPPKGGYVPWNRKNADKNVGQWLMNAGYHTVHIGKYINGYAFPNRPRADVPGGWNEWHGSADPSTYQMYGYRVNGNTPRQSHKYGKFPIQNPKNYSTDVYAGMARDVIRRQSKADQPFYMQVAFLAPHVETIPLKRGFIPQNWADVDNPDPSTGISTIPPRPALRHKDAFPNMPLEMDPSFNEADVSDKGSFVRNLPLLTDDQIEELVQDNRQRRRSLLSVDDAVGNIVKTLKETGQYKNTVIVVMGDNGYMLGQYRISMGKYFPYEPSIRIPFMMMGPGIRKNSHNNKLVSLIDVTPTLLDLANAKPSGRVPDGMSLKPLLRGGDMRTRSVLLSSGPQRGPNGEMLPRYSGVRSPKFAWWLWQDGFEEMYDLTADPYELTNVAANPSYQQVRSQMISQWHKLRKCKGVSCRKRTTAP